MRSKNEHNAPSESSLYREARLLSEVDRNSVTSQRSLARRLGIALSMTNLLLRNLSRKGYIRITQAGWRRWVYALTPLGFTRKAGLMSAYVRRFLHHYQWIQEGLRDELGAGGLNLESRVALYGNDEFAELVYTALRGLRVEKVDVFSSHIPDGRVFLGVPLKNISALRPEHYDRIVVAALEEEETDCAALREVGVADQQMITFFPHAQQIMMDSSERE